jgi:hypothetical protein
MTITEAQWAEACRALPCECDLAHDPQTDGLDGRARECPHDGDGDPRNYWPAVSALLEQHTTTDKTEIERLTGSLEILLTDGYLGDDGQPKTDGYWEDHARFARLLVKAAIEGTSRPLALADAEVERLTGLLDTALAYNKSLTQLNTKFEAERDEARAEIERIRLHEQRMLR